MTKCACGQLRVQITGTRVTNKGQGALRQRRAVFSSLAALWLSGARVRRFLPPLSCRNCTCRRCLWPAYDQPGVCMLSGCPPQPNTALEHYTSALGAHPGDSSLLLGVARVYDALGDADKVGRAAGGGGGLGQREPHEGGAKRQDAALQR